MTATVLRWWCIRYVRWCDLRMGYIVGACPQSLDRGVFEPGTAGERVVLYREFLVQALQ